MHTIDYIYVFDAPPRTWSWTGFVSGSDSKVGALSSAPC